MCIVYVLLMNFDVELICIENNGIIYFLYQIVFVAITCTHFSLLADPLIAAHFNQSLRWQMVFSG